MSKILVRFDDICPTMDWRQWEYAVKLLEQYNIKPLLGVIPDCQDLDLRINEPRTDFWGYIKELEKKGYTIAQHGVHHTYHQSNAKNSLYTKGTKSEFIGLDYEDQVKKLKHGKTIMESHGIRTNIFFAPSHSYDKNTLKALYNCGFRIISDGKSKKALLREGILCLPCRSAGCPTIRNRSYYTAIFHAHEWTRTDKMQEFGRFKALCEQHNREIVSFWEYMKQPVGVKLPQVISEKAYLIWEYQMKPVINPMLQLIKISQG